MCFTAHARIGKGRRVNTLEVGCDLHNNSARGVCALESSSFLYYIHIIVTWAVCIRDIISVAEVDAYGGNH